MQTGSTAALPGLLILATTAVTAQWTVYGLIIRDNFVFVPNFLGFAVALLQAERSCRVARRCKSLLNFLLLVTHAQILS